MKDIRFGDDLWEEWDGHELSFNKYLDSTIYYTKDHTNLKNELVKRALASALQKDGVAISLAEGFKIIETSQSYYGWVGYLEEDNSLSECDEHGETDYGDLVVNNVPVTWIVL
jgi:hypothetical protein